MSLESLDTLSKAIEKDPGKLRIWLQKNYDLEEFQDLCQDLNIKYDLLRGENLNKARSLANKLVRDRGGSHSFLKYLQENNPKHLQSLRWMMIKKASEASPETQFIINTRFDAFLSHHNCDKPVIREIYAQLVRQEIKPWLDEIDLPDGHWNEIFAELLPNLRSAVIFSGRNGLGSEQKREIRAFIEWQKRKESFKIIPVILRGGTDIFELDPLLALDVRVDFNQDVDPMEKLVRFIKRTN